MEKENKKLKWMKMSSITKKKTKTELIKLFLYLFIFLSPINQNIPAII